MPLYALLALLLQTPLILMELDVARAVWFSRTTTLVKRGGQTALVELAGVFLVGVALQCIVAYGVYARLRGRPVGLLESMRGLRRFFVVLGVAVLVGVMMWGALGVLTVLGAFGGFPITPLFVVAGIIVFFLLYCTYFLAVQVAIVERTGVIRAMARSAWLTSGSRWPVFAVILLVYLIQFMGHHLLMKSVFPVPATWPQLVVRVLSVQVLTAFVSAFQAVVAAVFYFEVRRAKEGIGIDEILDVFA